MQRPPNDDLNPIRQPETISSSLNGLSTNSLSQSTVCAKPDTFKMEGKKMSNLNIDLSQIEESSSEVLPAGLYPAKIIESRVKLSNAGNHMLTAKFEIQSQTGKNVSLTDYFVLNNHIGLKRLKELAIAAKVKNPNQLSDTSELDGLEVAVYLTRRTDEYGVQNKVARFLDLSELEKSNTGPIQLTFDDI